jgi:hypothetical protein
MIKGIRSMKFWAPRSVICVWLLLVLLVPSGNARVLIPMDLEQRDHLKAYGMAWWSLERGVNVEWLLNYRGGSFVVEDFGGLQAELNLRGVSSQTVSGGELASIYALVEASNRERIQLEKAPKVAVYAPPSIMPWDDAVMMALDYAEIDYIKIWDEDVLGRGLEDIDWLHLHHEDFTGQYGKFWQQYGTTVWYQKQQLEFEQMALRLGFAKVSQLKLAVALKIRDYMSAGGFVFAMCSATDSYDIALAAMHTDICASVFDGDPVDARYMSRLDYDQCVAFQNFTPRVDPGVYEFSDIDRSPLNGRSVQEAQDWFELFEFSAKWDPVPSMLTQNHTALVHGFMGQTTAYDRAFLKDHVIVLGVGVNEQELRYIHGVVEKGSFTFYGGHDPEDYRHMVGDPETQLALHRNSPGYRLILNNVLFPAAKKKKRKT